jgi:hypothetical protein
MEISYRRTPPSLLERALRRLFALILRSVAGAALTQPAVAAAIQHVGFPEL